MNLTRSQDRFNVMEENVTFKKTEEIFPDNEFEVKYENIKQYKITVEKSILILNIFQKKIISSVKDDSSFSMNETLVSRKNQNSEIAVYINQIFILSSLTKKSVIL